MFACTRKDRLTARNGSPIWRSSCATAPAPSRRARSATPTSSPASSSAATSSRSPGASSAFATSCRSSSRPIKRAGEACRPGRVPADRLPRPRRARRLPRAPRARGLRRRTCARCSTPSSATPASAPTSAARPARARATTPTWAACSSTRWRWRRSRSRPARSTRGSTRTCSLTAAILHDVGKLREFELGAEIALERGGHAGGPCGARPAADRRARGGGSTASREAKLHALLHCVLAHHGADALPGRRFRTPEALALARLNALDAAVKGALEHGLD